MDLLDAAKCGVCLDLYTDPRFLACGHTYCQACLDPMLHGIQGKTGKFFQCPECREETKQTNGGLQKNYAIRSMVDKIKNSSGSQGVDKCSGCQKTVLLGELFRCTTCKENSASAADAEIRVCGTCLAKTHKGHDYQELDVASKADFDDARKKIDTFKEANDAKETILREKKGGILVAKRKISLFISKKDVNEGNALTKAQLAAKVEKAELLMENGDIAAAFEALDDFNRKLAEIPSLQPPASSPTASRRVARRASLSRQPSAPARRPSSSTTSRSGVSARTTAARSAPRRDMQCAMVPGARRQHERIFLDDSDDDVLDDFLTELVDDLD